MFFLVIYPKILYVMSLSADGDILFQRGLIMKIDFKNVCIFWGVCDAFYIIRFIWIGISNDCAPLIDDLMKFWNLTYEYGFNLNVVALFLFSLILNVSIFFSAPLLLLKSKNIRILVYSQIPLRLFLVVPSLSFAPWLLKQFNIGGVGVSVFIIIFSEFFKLLSFVLTTKRKDK